MQKKLDDNHYYVYQPSETYTKYKINKHNDSTLGKEAIKTIYMFQEKPFQIL